MATNQQVNQVFAENLAVVSGAVSGDPVIVGFIVGVAETTRDASGNAIVHFGPAIWSLSVKGIDGSGNSAVAVGDKIYFTTGDTPHLSKKATGVPFGYALEAVTSAATATIKVFVTPGV